jgi:hypothetical protein
MYLFTKLCQYFFFLHTFVRPFNTNITNTIMQNNYGHFIQYCEWPPLEKVHDPKNLFSSVSKSKIDLSYCIVFWVLPEHTVQYDMIKKKKKECRIGNSFFLFCRRQTKTLPVPNRNWSYNIVDEEQHCFYIY